MVHTLYSKEASLIQDEDFERSYRRLGAHIRNEEGSDGVQFTVWAPAAAEVSIACDRNGWDGKDHRLYRLKGSGLWTGFMSDMQEGDLYKYEIITQNGDKMLKADPYAFYAEVRPRTASIVKSLDRYSWGDTDWMRKRRQPYDRPINIYEAHLGTWRKRPDGSFATYEELSLELIAYVVEMGYTHIELLPVTEHPYDRSWGYQATGYYAPTSRYGTPEQFMLFIDRCHQNGLGVILDWVPGHFGKDEHGLRRFDGSALFEHEDPLIAEKPVWGTLAFDYSKPEVRSFLISNALFWMEVYHIDGLRVDAVSSMLYHDFDKPEGAWRPNLYGGRENLEAIGFLKELNQTVFHHYPHALMMAEESHAFPGVTSKTELEGLGFNYKWNMGWMNDTLAYMEEPFHRRKYRHSLLTFPIWYAWQENHALPLSHDEVVHGKKSLLNKMPGSYEQKFAGLRLLYGYMMTHPGKKLLFMGGEFGQFDEWKDEGELDWMVLRYDKHRTMKEYTKALNHLYRHEKALWQLDHDHGGFEWIDHADVEQSVIVYRRKAKAGKDALIVVCNFHSNAHPAYRIGVPSEGSYRVALNSDEVKYGGNGYEALRLEEGSEIASERKLWHKRRHSIELALPPLSVVILKRKKKELH
ncbi:1,4-alpha-glucan branching protein GlgB [Paenibacillus sp. sgz302251]|uniref:1,4-alpha-glucan branching protein GlgB n=1 Tax=Paenibacillus sp. sgz302251 TaxID=3414493 RepID=UPI003C7D1062